VIIGVDASRLTATTMTGTERYSCEVITALLRIAPQHDYRLYVRQPESVASLFGKGGEYPQGHKLNIISIAQSRLWTHIGLAREIAIHPPDALFIPAHVLPLPQVVWRTTRTVVTIHDVGYRHFPQAHPFGQRLYLDWSTALNARCASAVVADSEATRRDVQRFYGTTDCRINVAYPGPLPLVAVGEGEARSIRARYGVGDGCTYVLFVGTLQPRKNLRRLIEAWRELTQTVAGDAMRAANHVATPLLLVAGAKGWGSEDLQGLVNSYGLSASVRFTGYITDLEKAALMRGARAFAFPSLYEGFGFPVLEAQEAGVPVVCSKSSSLPEVAGDGALLVDPLDVKAIAAALKLAMYDDGCRLSLVTMGHGNIKRFSWEQCAKVILNLLESR
jgi:glycosyltransferase involved in cell wall biosynthesis